MSKNKDKIKDLAIRTTLTDNLLMLIKKSEISSDADLLRQLNDFCEKKDMVPISQPRFSDIKNKKATPTLNETILLSDFFNVSIDELLGRGKKNAPTGKETLADIIQILFSLDGYLGIEIHDQEETDKKISISFTYKRILDFLTEWKKVREATQNMDPDIKSTLYNSWKDKTIEKYNKMPVRNFSIISMKTGRFYAGCLLDDYVKYIINSSNQQNTPQMDNDEKITFNYLKEKYCGDKLIQIKEYVDSITPDTLDTFLPICNPAGKQLSKSEWYDILVSAITVISNGIPLN